MKRFGFLYERIVSVENCRLAILNASQKKKKRKMVKEVLDNLEYYANDLSERMSRMDFLSPYKTRIIKDRVIWKRTGTASPGVLPRPVRTPRHYADSQADLLRNRPTDGVAPISPTGALTLLARVWREPLCGTGNTQNIA